MGGDMSGMLSLVLVVVVFWLFLIKPQQKQQKKEEEIKSIEIPETLTIIIKVRNQQIDEEGIERDRVVLEDNWRFSFDTDRDKLLEMVEEIEINETTEIGK